jgi:hypothetical protein
MLTYAYWIKTYNTHQSVHRRPKFHAKETALLSLYCEYSQRIELKQLVDQRLGTVHYLYLGLVPKRYGLGNQVFD